MKSSPIYLIIFFIEIYFSIKSSCECLLKLAKETKEFECSSLKCNEISNPTKLLKTSCQIHFLKLFFTTEDDFFNFMENQFQSETLIEEFFLETDQQNNTIEIEIDSYNCHENDDLLSLDMFTYLGGENDIIDIFSLKINRWINEKMSCTKFIDENILLEQPFKQIHLFFFCYVNSTFLHWIFYENEKTIQQKSPCPTQIQIESQNSLLQQQIYPLEFNQTISSKQYQTQNNNYSIIIIFIFICLIGIGILLCIYYYRRLNKSLNLEIDTPLSDIDQTY
ncbi:hypothetical protein I4U23_017367 [Adineta vaga]|nr:hypothetical protein I4U23_017367 [Adineta vaga]